MPAQQRQTIVVAILCAMICIGAMAVYIPTAAQGLIYGGGVESESAQLQRVANRLGIAHSTGYPLHTLSGYVAARLADAVGENPYTAITYTSTIAVAAGLVWFFLAARLVGSTASAFAATALLAATSTVWHIATITETQALHFACMTAIWWGTLAHIEQPNRTWPLAVIALASGIGLANHRTIVFSIGAAGLVILLGWTWRTWSARRWVLLIVLTLLPLLSYGYLYARVNTDPFVVYSTRPSWFPAQIDNAVVTDLIRGTLQSGEGLEGNLVLPDEDAEERFIFVRTNLQHDITTLWLGLGVVGWLLVGLHRPRLLLAGGFMAASWIIFLMSWRLDWKAVIYQHALLLLASLGVAMVFAAPRYLPQRLVSRRTWITHPALMTILALPIALGAYNLYNDHVTGRDLSGDNRGDVLYAQLDALPSGVVYQTGGWTPDAFILLEYLDDTQRTDVLPIGAESADEVATRAANTDETVIFGPFLRGFFGLYSGSLFFQERGLSFSGTTGPDLFQLRPNNDPRLIAEVSDATPLNISISPDVTLLAYAIDTQADAYVLTLYWRADNVPMPHYSIFTHLRQYGSACDEATLQSLISQDDSAGPVRNMHPTTVWQAEEIVKDTYFIPRPELLPDGAAIVVGMTLNGQRTGQWCTPAP